MSSITLVRAESKIDEWGFPLKSTETSSSSQYCNTPLSGPSAAGAHGIVDCVCRDGFTQFGDQVDDRDICGWDTDGHAVEFPFEFREHFAHSAGRTGRGRNHRLGCRSCSANVRVGQVQDALVVGIGVHSRHQAMRDAKRFVQDFGHGRETIGRARRIRDDVVGCWIVVRMVDTVADRNIRIFGWGRNNDLFGAGRQMQ